jgi:8-oxo-dGTP diphosphatase
MISDYHKNEVKTIEPHKFERWEWFEWDKLPKPLFVPIQNLIKENYNPLK